VATGLLRMQHGPSGPAIGQLDVRGHQYALWIGLNPLKADLTVTPAQAGNDDAGSTSEVAP
jgi:hypothetical protein